VSLDSWVTESDWLRGGQPHFDSHLVHKFLSTTLRQTRTHSASYLIDTGSYFWWGG
jgi:hypothetical protein